MWPKNILLFLIVILIISLSSCELLSSTKVSSTEIKNASGWSSKDQPPSFPECEGVEKKEQLNCLQSIISDQLKLAISDFNIISLESFKQEIIIQIKIDKEGIFSLLDAKIPNTVRDALPELEQILKQAIANLPSALPATKTNVGVFVDSQLTMPVQISAQPL
tara:strand:- start:223 stop:711 length:489 start_codon:yes stop_codon:yes gene_type:complete